MSDDQETVNRSRAAWRKMFEDERFENFKARAEITRLRAGIQAMLDGNYPNPRSYRPGKCPHGLAYYEACENCAYEWLAGLLNPTLTTTRGDN